MIAMKCASFFFTGENYDIVRIRDRDSYIPLPFSLVRWIEIKNSVQNSLLICDTSIVTNHSKGVTHHLGVGGGTIEKHL